MITVIGAGSGRAENITLDAFNRIKNAKKVFLRTEKMALARLLESEGIEFESFDGLYDSAEDFDRLNESIAKRLESEQDCCYAVFGSALDDTSVMKLKNKEIIPGVSLADCAASFLDMTSERKDFSAVEVLSGTLPSTHTLCAVTCIDSRMIASDLKCVLSEIYGDEYEILMYHEDFDGNQFSTALPLYELDMQKEYNHTTSVFLKKCETDKVYKYDIGHLREVVERLCSPDGCPWDSVQTHESLRPYLIEEAYEVAETIDKNDYSRLYDELGDVLLQVVFHATLGKNEGEFDFSDITDSITRKMIRRHPALFAGEETEKDPKVLNDQWESSKKTEKGLGSVGDVLHDVPDILPSLAYAEKIQYKAEKAGINTVPKNKNILEVTATDEASLGKLLFDAVALCRANGVHPELALHAETLRFIDKTVKE